MYVEAVVMEISPSFVKNLGFEFRGGAPLQSGDNVDRVLIGGTEFAQGTNVLLDKITGTAATTASSTGTTQTTSLNPLALDASGLTLGAIFDTITIMGPNGNEITLPANIFLLHALQKDSNANILSTPHLIAIDNEEAEIVVGRNVPFISSTSQSTISTMTSIDRENVGITLKFTPQINESNYVVLKLYEEISALIDSPIGQDPNRVGPTTSTRKATNTVLVKDGQTIVIGGLVEDRIVKSRTKVPWLGDIPLLGWFFRYDEDKIEKTNLLLFLTPTIVKEDQEVQRIYQEKKKQMLQYKSRQKIPDSAYDVRPFEKDEQSKKGQKDNKYDIEIKGAYPLELDENQTQGTQQP